LHETYEELNGIFVQGASGHLAHVNINVDKRLTNGTPVIYESLIIENELDQRRVREGLPGQLIELENPPSCIIVRCPSLELSVQDQQLNWPNSHTMLEENVLIPIFATSGKEVELDKNRKVKMKSFDVELGFSITFHKVQGQTIEKIIIDLNHRPGKSLGHLCINSVFVALSRVRSSESIR